MEGGGTGWGGGCGGGPRQSSCRGGAVVVGVVGMIATLAIGLLVVRATKDDTPETDNRTAAQKEAARDVIGQANLTAVPDAGADKALGVAQFVERDGQRIINVLAEGLPKAPKGSGYGVWMRLPPSRSSSGPGTSRSRTAACHTTWAASSRTAPRCCSRRRHPWPRGSASPCAWTDPPQNRACHCGLRPLFSVSLKRR